MDMAKYNAVHRAWYIKQRRERLPLAYVACIIANANRKKGTPAFSVGDFLGEFAKEEPC